MIKDKLGMISLFEVLLIMILAAVITTVLFTSAYTASSMVIRQQQNFSNYQTAVLYANRGVWLIKKGYVTPATPFPYVDALPGSTLGITYDAGISTYTITANSVNSAITATVSGNKIKTWN